MPSIQPRATLRYLGSRKLESMHCCRMYAMSRCVHAQPYCFCMAMHWLILHTALHMRQPPVRRHRKMTGRGPNFVRQGSTEGIMAMQESRQARHDAAWQQFVAERDIATHALEQNVAAAVNGLKVST